MPGGSVPGGSAAGGFEADGSVPVAAEGLARTAFVVEPSAAADPSLLAEVKGELRRCITEQQYEYNNI